MSEVDAKEVKLCTQCKHRKFMGNEWESARCVSPLNVHSSGATNLVNGEPIRLVAYCVSARESQYCGREARWFEATYSHLERMKLAELGSRKKEKALTLDDL